MISQFLFARIVVEYETGCVSIKPRSIPIKCNSINECNEVT